MTRCTFDVTSKVYILLYRPTNKSIFIYFITRKTLVRYGKLPGSNKFKIKI
jgi:hypothetical protein